MAAKTKPETKPETTPEEEEEEKDEPDPKPGKGGKNWEQRMEALEQSVQKLLSGGTQPGTQKVKVPPIPEPEPEGPEELEEPEAPEPGKKKRGFLDWLL